VKSTRKDAADFERALARASTEKVRLKLYIAGMTPRSTRAVAGLKRLSAEHGDRLSVEIIDIYERPEAAADAQVIAVPTLVREHPCPVRKLIGALDNLSSIASSLGLAPLSSRTVP